MNSRTTAFLAGISLVAIFVAGCGDDAGDNDTDGNDVTIVESPPATTAESATSAPAASATPAPGPRIDDDDAFARPGGDDVDAVTYDEVAVPVGAKADVDTDDDDGRTTVTLTVTGLQPNRDFGAHVHTRPCGPNPSDAGSHYQNQADPAATPDSPSTDPAYANPQNEIWMDFTTDDSGNARATSTVEWEFRDDEAESVVIHDHHTMTAPGEAGMAGDRLACIDED
ncbi:superoxide dismutase family protein [Rhodococcus artemisiae]|uniref:Superoxide dismutase family protein n=1 Tax=Rhodococcus artemisiae TaxID=714159 RepID=A0ABU7L8W5_9NOCA|nr:superoxide dismutase family protein [Rhodococcus artemisiae]MEE2057991.1 superoxide dismutase family protein [Rhodococcus artemisiae]